MDQDLGVPVPPFQDVAPILSGPVRTIGFLVLGSMCHGFFRLLSDFEAVHVDRLYDAVEKRPHDVGLVTVMNHASVVDELVLGSVCKFSWLWNTSKLRWTLAAEDFCFKYPILSTFFKTMKAIPIKRGAGLEQPAVFQARQLVQQGEWLHLYPEGKVSQDGNIQRIRRGVARVIESESGERIPIVVPMYIAGVQDCVPLGTWFPRPGRTITMIVGPEIPLNDIVSKFTVGSISREEYDSLVAQRVQEHMLLLKAEGDVVHSRRVNERTGSLWDGVFGKQTTTYSSFTESKSMRLESSVDHPFSIFAQLNQFAP